LKGSHRELREIEMERPDSIQEFIEKNKEMGKKSKGKTHSPKTKRRVFPLFQFLDF
jgi:hypothetical protein